MEEKLARRLDKSGDCWIWLGAVGTSGYGTSERVGGAGLLVARMLSL
jgi:hypothetical protein